MEYILMGPHCQGAPGVACARSTDGLLGQWEAIYAIRGNKWQLGAGGRWSARREGVTMDRAVDLGSGRRGAG